MALGLALLAAAVFGVADFFGGVAGRRAPLVSVLVLVRSVGLAMMVVAVSVTSGVATVVDVAWGAAGGLSGAVGLAALYYGLAMSRMGIVAPAVAVWGAAFPVAGGLLLGERPTPLAMLGVLLALPAIGLVSMSPSVPPPAAGGGKPESRPRLGRVAVVAVIFVAGCGIGGFYVLLARAAPSAGLWPVLGAQAAGLAVYTLAAVARGQPLLPARAAVSAALPAAVLDATGNALFLIAVYRGPLTLVALLTSFYPVTTVLCANRVLGERIGAVQLVGFVVAAAAVVLITVG